MRLDFNTLWIEDQPKNVKSSKDSLKRKIKKEGFNFCSETVKSFEDLPNYVGPSILEDSIDLFFVDCNLDNGHTGIEAIKSVREQLPYRDIIFYSADSTSNLYDIITNARVEGVFCATRSELVDDAFKLFKNNVKKFLDADNFCGLVMGATSEIDHIIVMCLQSLYNKTAGDLSSKEKFLKGIKDKIGRQHRKRHVSVEKMSHENDFAKMLEAHDIWTSTYRLEFLIHQLKQKNFEHHNDAKDKLSTYLKDIVPQRNLLAHINRATNNAPQRYVNFDEQKAQNLRCALLDYREIFSNLAANLAK